MNKKLLLLLPLSASLAVACGGVDDATSEVISEARRFDPEDPPDYPDPDESDPPPPQLIAPGLDIIQRSSTQIVLRWRDNNDIEHGNTIERREGVSAQFITLSNQGTQSMGLHDYVDASPLPDREYCYRVKTWDGSNTMFSPTKCAWTPASTSDSVWRLQLRVRVADANDAGTDDAVSVALNASTSWEFPYGNRTVMDYGRNDFERNSVFTYDLDMVGVSTMADINRIELSKTGDDGVCIHEIALIVNQEEVFSRVFGNSSPGCLWLDNASPHSTTFLVQHSELRASSGWRDYMTSLPPIIMLREDLESRIEGLVGNAISGSELQWGHIHGRAVEITKVSTDVFRIDLDLEAGVNNVPNPEVDVDMDMRIFFSESQTTPGTWDLNLNTVSWSVETDYHWFSQLVSYLIEPLCSVVVVIYSGEVGWGCAATIEGYVENRVRNGLKPIEKAFNVGGFCTPMVEVRDNGNLSFGCAP